MIDSRPSRRPGAALPVVDVQRAFLPGGAPGVPGGDAVMGPLNEALALCSERDVRCMDDRQGHRPGLPGFARADLEQRLREAGVRRLVVGGLATDYCVLQTVLDARERGLEVRRPRQRSGRGHGTRATDLDQAAASE
jgi:nicotinamidase/pyrazinamidase